MERSKLRNPRSFERPSIGIKAVFAIVGTLISSSLYFSLGVVTDNALQWTPVVFLVAGVFFVLAAMTYAEGSSVHQERGGSTVLARYAFNELVSFIAGWAILIDYLILVAICAFTATNYAATFWPQLGEGSVEVLFATAIIAYVAIANIQGVSVRRLPKVALFNLFDLIMQVLVIALGLALVFNPDVLTEGLMGGDMPSAKEVIYAMTLATVAYPGIEAAAGMAGEVDGKSAWYGRMIWIGTPLVFLTYIAIALVATSVLPVGEQGTDFGSRAIEAPVIEIVSSYDPSWLADLLKFGVAGVATLLLITAASSSMLGLSRLSYSLATNRQIPGALGWLHSTQATPYVLITIAAAISVALVIPGNIELLVGLYAFGAMLAFTIAHISVCVLRFREPERERFFWIPFSVRIGRGSLPIPAVIGAIGSAAAWVSVLVLHDSARWLGLAWMAFGIALYVTYRKYDGSSLFKRVTVPEQALREEPPEAEYGSILVPLFGTALDDDIVQTAGRLAAEEGPDSELTMIEALWVFEIPISLPIDASLPKAKLQEARAALARAKAIGEEYEGVTVATATVRGRSAGKAIVDEARRRGVEAIVLAAEEPSRIRTGALLGSASGPIENYVGEATKYVISKASCRVVLTAPPTSH